MLTINLKSRFRNKTFILAMVGAIVLLIQQLGFKEIIPSNYADIVNSVLSILVMLGIVVDTSTKGISDQVISDATVQAINQATETKEEVKTEDSTIGINGVITENSQSSSDDASTSVSDKESETNSGVDTSSNVQVSTENSIATSSNDNATPVIDPIAIQAENQQLKSQLASIQSLATAQV